MRYYLPRNPPNSISNHPVKLQYGSDFEEGDAEDSETDSESAESEDEDGEELTPAIDAAILRTLARIKRKDPEIYKSEKGIFEGTLLIINEQIASISMLK